MSEPTICPACRHTWRPERGGAPTHCPACRLRLPRARVALVERPPQVRLRPLRRTEVKPNED